MRHTGKPASTLAALEAADAENPSRLSAHFLFCALSTRRQADDVAPEYREAVIARALWYMGCARERRS